MNTATEARTVPLARRFLWRFLEGKLAEAKSVIFTEAGSEPERIAIVVEALKQSSWSYKLANWIQSWFTLDAVPAEEGAAQKVIEDRRTYRIGNTYRNHDRVRLDGQFFVTVVENQVDTPQEPKRGKIKVQFEAKGKEPETLVVSRHRLAHL